MWLHNTAFGMYAAIHMFVPGKNETKRKFAEQNKAKKYFFFFSLRSK
jgi:hypothetical protein